MYIGLNDIRNEATFEWMDKTPVRYIRWASGHSPNLITLLNHFNNNGFSVRFCVRDVIGDLKLLVEPSEGFGFVLNAKQCHALDMRFNKAFLSTGSRF